MDYADGQMKDINRVGVSERRQAEINEVCTPIARNCQSEY